MFNMCSRYILLRLTERVANKLKAPGFNIAREKVFTFVLH
ncbi:unnamed protein product [Amoebophrya sp. A25]|nr:unnamed protein product [Amoebophrya sp. A25]|eukprot:GSA25T00009965001.1